jgi:hypothetical protein
MRIDLRSTCCSLAAFTTIALAGCGTSQLQTTPAAASPQNAVAAAPSLQSAAACPVVGKTYKMSVPPGQISATLAAASVKAGSTGRLQTRLIFSKWPEGRTIDVTDVNDVGCGPQSKNPSHATVEEGGGRRSDKCHHDVCTITLDTEIKYAAPTTLPGDKPYKFDVVRFTRKRGTQSVPVLKITITP